jgi:hypothetical protein
MLSDLVTPRKARESLSSIPLKHWPRLVWVGSAHPLRCPPETVLNLPLKKTDRAPAVQTPDQCGSPPREG